MGILPRVAMGMTLREITIYADGRNKAKREEWKKSITIAHLTAGLGRAPAKKFPALADLLPREPVVLTSEKRREGIWNMAKLLARPGEIKKGKKRK